MKTWMMFNLSTQGEIVEAWARSLKEVVTSQNGFLLEGLDSNGTAYAVIGTTLYAVCEKRK